jgi:hypothetical protein
MNEKRTEFIKLLIIDAWSSRRRSRTLRDEKLIAWLDGIKNADLCAIRLYRKHKRQGRL